MLRARAAGVLRNLPTTVVIERLARVWVDVAAREVAAQDVEANAMAALKRQRCSILPIGDYSPFPFCLKPPLFNTLPSDLALHFLRTDFGE